MEHNIQNSITKPADFRSFTKREITLAILVILLGGLFLWSLNVDKSDDVVSEATPSAEPDVPGCGTYSLFTDPELNFSIEYPCDFEPTLPDFSSGERLNLYPFNEPISVSAKLDSDGIFEVPVGGDSVVVDFNARNQSENTYTTANGYQAYMVKGGDACTVIYGAYVYNTATKYLYSVTINSLVNDPPACDLGEDLLVDDRTIYNMIDTLKLGAFELIDTTDTSSWQTYRNDKYGFEIKFPPDFEISIFKPEDSKKYDHISITNNWDIFWGGPMVSRKQWDSWGNTEFEPYAYFDKDLLNGAGGIGLVKEYNNSFVVTSNNRAEDPCGYLYSGSDYAECEINLYVQDKIISTILGTLTIIK